MIVRNILIGLLLGQERTDMLNAILTGSHLYTRQDLKAVFKLGWVYYSKKSS
ncbi:hypothetical protein JCM10914A_28730 [Paenibacillus sp. JCM 10914]|nr:hypothetical protein JCM10914_4702 [Paenibacillus sp. JCM 10914]